jgi:uncharacterized protein YbjT (DUF2867 family)
VILVTGGTGFIGPKVVRALRTEDREVRCLVRRPNKVGTLKSWGCDLVEGDVTDPDSLQAAAEGCDAVVHLVSIITGRRADFQRVMTGGTQNLVAAAQAAGARRFVLMSALGVTEQTRTLVPYYESKWEMEQAVQASGLEHVIFRPSFVFGRDGGALPLFVKQVRWSPVTPVMGSGKRRLQPIWVEDVAAFFAAAIDLPDAANRTFELGGPDRVTWNELYERIARTLGKRRTRMHVPVSVARLGATVVERLPRAPLTRDQLTMLEAGDNVCDTAPARAAFGIAPIGLDEQLRRAG